MYVLDLTLRLTGGQEKSMGMESQGYSLRRTPSFCEPSSSTTGSIDILDGGE